MAALLAAATLAAFLPTAAGAAEREEGREERRLRPARDILAAGEGFLRDGARITLSPLRISRADALRLGGVAAVTALLYTNDEAILDWYDRNEDAPPLEPAGALGERIERAGLMGVTMKYYAAALPVAYLLGWERPTAALAQVLESHLIAGAFKNLAARHVGRARPWEGCGSRTFRAGRSTSFPSGHSSTIFQAATIFSHHARRTSLSVLAYALATTVCLQRLKSDSHWPSDVFVGAVYGAAVARAVIRFHEERREARRALLLPYHDPASGAAGLSVALSF